MELVQSIVEDVNNAVLFNTCLKYFLGFIEYCFNISYYLILYEIYLLKSNRSQD